ncbi:hypothetical protein WSS_A02115 [Rhodococcus opacus M213]|uniref:Uncharacterized protein n=1 Tax=Rhodococcus opacus M213 TaxID=1129896 RepID=K8XRY6_RHOOP|nr:hypothetical protein WSS_A02115 [Rhodococcus opacus M213]
MPARNGRYESTAVLSGGPTVAMPCRSTRTRRVTSGVPVLGSRWRNSSRSPSMVFIDSMSPHPLALLDTGS